MSTEDSVVEGGGECNTTVLTKFVFKYYDVNNHGVELGKSTTIDLVFVFRQLRCGQWYFFYPS